MSSLNVFELTLYWIGHKVPIVSVSQMHLLENTMHSTTYYASNTWGMQHTKRHFLVGQSGWRSPYGNTYVHCGQVKTSRKKMSKRNRKNRRKQRINHTGGRKPFIRIMEEMNEQASNLVAFYKEVHWSRKQGKFITGTAEHNYNLMLERLNENEVDGDMDEAANAVFKEVLGYRPGYAAGLGHSVIPEPSLSLRNNRDYQRIVEENEKNKNDANLYKNQFEALKSELLEFRNQFNDYEKLMNTRMKDLESQRESHNETPIDT